MYCGIFNLPNTAPAAINRLAAPNSARISRSISFPSEPRAKTLPSIYIGSEILTSKKVAVSAERPYFLTKTIRNPNPTSSMAMI